MDHANKGNRAADGRSLSPSSGFLGKRILPARGAQVKAGAGTDPPVGEKGRRLKRPGWALPGRGQRTFREKRFSEGGSVSQADGTTCYPGRAHGGATAHYGVSVTGKGSENERAQSTERPTVAKGDSGPRAVFRKVLQEPHGHSNRPVEFTFPASPTPVARGCAARSASATGPPTVAGQRRQWPVCAPAGAPGG